jgi:EAL domain-containing protein (putative c-di-GMP-specific phosphodiesterase class I)
MKRVFCWKETCGIHYQPIVDLLTARITGMEALIRWQHPEQGMLFPATFVPIAEECGLILPIGQWVLLEACRQSRMWSDSGIGIVPVSVNVSAAEFRANDFLSEVRAVLMQDAESAVISLLALEAIGVRLAIDDFGTGYSSFTYLRRFPVHSIKIDRSFVQEITADPEKITLVGVMINIGKSLKLGVIAEGVETSSQFEFLQRHGCGEAQGYYFSPPVASEQAGELLKAGKIEPRQIPGEASASGDGCDKAQT